jgi:surfactin synthase thioesterase subunit
MRSEREVLVFATGREPPRLRLICLPYAGGGATVFRTWAQSLPPGVEVVAPELPGRGSRMADRPVRRLTALVDELGARVRPHLDRPFALFGHSLGALVAFELARRLRREGAAPRLLFASAAGAPQHGHGERAYHTLPDAEFVRKIASLNGTAPAVLLHGELMRLLLPALRADFEAFETYAYAAEPPLDCPIAGLVGAQDSLVRAGDMEGWREQTSARFALHVIAGDHFFVNTQAQRLLAIVRAELASIDATEAGRSAPGAHGREDVDVPAS